MLFLENLNNIGSLRGAFPNAESIQYDGVSKHSNINSVLTALSSTTQGTIEGWIKPNFDTDSYFLTFSDTNANEFIIVRCTQVGFFQVTVRKAGVTQWSLVSDNQVFLDGVWTHFAVVMDGVEAKLYKDGIELTDVTFTNSTDKTAWFNDLTGLDNGRIASFNYNSLGDGFYSKANIDELLFTSDARTASQITTDYNNGSPKDLSTVSNGVSYFRIDGDTVPTMNDFIGSNNGTYVNCVQGDIVSDVPSVVTEFIDFNGLSELIFLGDSITVGNNATANEGYQYHFSQYYGSTSVDLAASGRGVWVEIDNINAQSFTRSDTAVFVCGGLNDLKRSDDVKTSNKIVSSLNSVIARVFSGGAVASGGASVTRGGTGFTAFDARAYGGVFPSGTLGTNVASFASTANNTWTWNFSADNVYIEFNGSSGATRGTCEVRIDGELVDTISDFDERWDGVSDGVNDNQLGPDTRIYTGLTDAAHSVEIKVISGGNIVVDAIGTLDDPANLGALVVVQIPYITDYSTPPLDQASDAKIDAANALREAIVDRFKALGYPIIFTKIMETKGGLYDLANIDDGTHPNTKGQLQIYSSIARHVTR
jgi:lysophospholipase L1-like esterase